MRFPLVLGLVLVAAVLAIATNLALLGYGQPRNDPAGQLTPRRLSEIETSPGQNQSSHVVRPRPDEHDTTVAGSHDDD
jgi:hypothetical protein